MNFDNDKSREGTKWLKLRYYKNWILWENKVNVFLFVPTCVWCTKILSFFVSIMCITSIICSSIVLLQTTGLTSVLYSRHLLSDQTDPFNRSPLTMDMIQPNVDLKCKIEEWIKERRAKTKDAWFDSHLIVNFFHRF